MNRKEELLQKIYFDPQGFSSMNKLFHDAKAIDNTITFDFVKNGISKMSNQRDM